MVTEETGATNPMIIVSVLMVFVVAMTLSAVSAKSVTFKLNKKYQYKDLKNGDTIECVYEPSSGGQYDKGVTVDAVCSKYGDLDYAKHTKLTKLKVWFKKNGKVIKRSSSKVRYDSIRVKLVKGYTPYKVKAYYKKK